MSNGLQGSALAKKIKDSPRWLAKKIFGIKTWDKQEEIIKSIFAHRRTAVRGCVSSTKTFAAALATMAWLLAYPQTGRVFHLAPSFRQVDKNLWGYLKALDAKATKNGTPLGAKVYEIPRMVFGPGWEYVGFSTKNPHNVHGIHGPNDLIILDDAHGIDQPIFTELENMFAGGNTHLLMLFNAVVLQGETYDCTHSQKGLWNNITITFDDLLMAYKAGHIIPGALQQEAVDIWARKFGIKSSFYQSKVNAVYPKEEKDSVIPLSFIEKAIVREVPKAGEGQMWYGQDVARFGDDESALCPIEGRRQLPIEAEQGARITETSGKLVAALRAKPGTAAVDVIGMGSGVVDNCKEENEEVIPVNVAESSEVLDEVGKQKFADLRSEMYWGLREALDPDNPDALAIDPQDKQLHGELSAIKWRFDSKGRIRVEAKADMKKRLHGQSPDRADAFALAVHARKIEGIEINLPADQEVSSLLINESNFETMGALEGLNLG